MPEVLQLYYTSCKRGVTDRPGAQTYSFSEGLSDDERVEVERFGLYIPPGNLPTEPDDEEIRTLFPDSFSFFRLKSGRYGVSRSTYIGRDYSGRWGNYFCHALILSEGRFPFHPIRLCDSPVFRSSLTPEEENAKKRPDPLPPLSLGDLQPDGRFTIEAAADFVSRQPDGARLSALLTALAEEEGDGRPVVVCDRGDHRAWWIAAATLVWPAAAAHNVTFTTYTVDPADGAFALAASTPEGHRLDVEEALSAGRYHLFDFAAGRFSAVDGENPLGLGVYRLYTTHPEALEKWRTFLAGFNDPGPSRGSAAAFQLFRVSRGEAGELTAAELTDILAFIQNRGRAEGLGDYVDQLRPAVERLLPELSVDGLFYAADFMFDAADESGRAQDSDQAYQVFFRGLDRLLFEAEAPDEERIIGFNDRILLSRRKEGDAFVKRFTAPERLAHFGQRLREKPSPRRARLVMTLLVNNLSAANVIWLDGRDKPGFTPLLEQCFHEMLDEPTEGFLALRAAADNVEYYAHLVALAAKVAEKEGRGGPELVIALKEINLTKPSGFTLKARRRLVDLGRADLVFDEFKRLLAGASDPEQFFWAYEDQIMAHIPEFKQQYFSPALQSLLDQLKPKRRFPVCARAFRHEDFLTDAALGRAIACFESELGLGPPPEHLTGDIVTADRLKNKRGLTTSPNKTGLLRFGLALAQKADQMDSLTGFLPEPFPTLVGADKKSYVKYLNWVLPHALPLADEGACHDLAAALHLPGAEAELVDRWHKHLGAWAQEVKSWEALKPYILFLLQRRPNDPEAVKRAFIDAAPGFLATQPPARLRRIVEFAETAFNGDPALLKKILEKSQERREKGILARAFGWFRR